MLIYSTEIKSGFHLHCPMDREACVRITHTFVRPWFLSKLSSFSIIFLLALLKAFLTQVKKKSKIISHNTEGHTFQWNYFKTNYLNDTFLNFILKNHATRRQKSILFLCIKDNLVIVLGDYTDGFNIHPQMNTICSWRYRVCLKTYVQVGMLNFFIIATYWSEKVPVCIYFHSYRNCGGSLLNSSHDRDIRK